VRAAILFALVLGACASPPEHRPEPAPAPQTVALPVDELPGLSNFAKVDDGLYRGAQPTSAGMGVLQSLGVQTIVNLRAVNSDRDEIAGEGFRYAHIACKAWHPEDEDVVRFLAIATDPANRPVFVHCEHGADRTGMMIAAYRVMEMGWTPEEAAAELPRFGFHTIWQGIRDRVLALNRDDLRRKVEAARRETLELVP
jgi:protein tyrosine/serine phosphatase